MLLIRKVTTRTKRQQKNGPLHGQGAVVGFYLLGAVSLAFQLSQRNRKKARSKRLHIRSLLRNRKRLRNRRKLRSSTS